ncbi:Hypothetical protein CINCED_3A003572 [Cinara cedri]|uniref:Uncharacterized protein n=1 Tax=Cinara cedri TaxID=506608 RepID=A0A5E4M8A6_9HEMI|nr:Hypothetical protein CINCED_3A003572 [Cinara cedri]
MEIVDPYGKLCRVNSWSSSRKAMVFRSVENRCATISNNVSDGYSMWSKTRHRGANTPGAFGSDFSVRSNGPRYHTGPVSTWSGERLKARLTTKLLVAYTIYYAVRIILAYSPAVRKQFDGRRIADRIPIRSGIPSWCVPYESPETVGTAIAAVNKSFIG